MSHHLAERVLWLAGERGRELKDILAQAEITPSQWASIGRGIFPDDSIIERLATVLGVGPEYLGWQFPEHVEQDLHRFLDYLANRLRLGRLTTRDLFKKHAPSVATQSYRGRGPMNDPVFRDLLRDERLANEPDVESGYRDDDELR